jgi:hypothetical protein
MSSRNLRLLEIDESTPLFSCRLYSRVMDKTTQNITGLT